MKPEIKQLTQVEDIYKTLLYFNDDIVPSIPERGIDLNEYAHKLFEFAVVYIFWLENQECGYVAFYANDTDHKAAYLAQIAVKKQFFKHGIGDALLMSAMETSKEKGMQTMKLEVYRQNQIAVEFYKRHGFSECSEVHGAFCYMQIDL